MDLDVTDVDISQNLLSFVWEKFVDEPTGAIEQIIIFIEQFVFLETLELEIGIDNAVWVASMDVDLRMPPNTFSSKTLEVVTIEIE